MKTRFHNIRTDTHDVCYTEYSKQREGTQTEVRNFEAVDSVPAVGDRWEAAV